MIVKDTAPICPHCGEIQSDMSNGGDPGEWWFSEYIPDGECETECDLCRKSFIVRIDWTPCFEGVFEEDD